jgi:hypothetical protein
MKPRYLFAPLLTVFLIISPNAANAYYYTVPGSEADWEWDISTSPQNGVDDLDILDKNGEYINGDLFDDFGVFSINGDEFDTSSSNGDIVEGQITFLGEAETNTEGGSVTWIFSDNYVRQVLISANPEDLEIYGNLGSDSDTTWLTQGTYLLSYENNGDGTGPDDDPIILWETDGEIKSEGEDSRVDGNEDVVVTANGTSLTVTMYAYAHRNDGSLDTTTFFQRFESFIRENKLRTDIFTVDWRPTAAAAPAPAPVYVRQTINLTFAQSLYASDTLSDPDGQLRKTIDLINAKYGSLIE